jgi:GT2 family glycosyltransferase
MPPALLPESTQPGSPYCEALTQPGSPSDRELQFAAERDSLRAIIETQKQEIHEYVRRTLVLRNYAEALDESASWRLLAPLRWLRRQLRPRGFVAEHLIPWSGLEPVEGSVGTWKALHDDPQFLVSCYLPAGWLRVRLKIHAPARGQIEFYGERRGDFGIDTLLGQFSLAHGETDEEFYLYLDRPTRALRIDPIDHTGSFRIERLEATPRPAWTLAQDSLRRKLRLLRAYRNTWPVLGRGLAMFFTGRWATVAAKWKLGLNDPRCIRHGFYEPEIAYEKWMARRRLTDADRSAQRRWGERLADPPVISLLMPTYNTPERFLRLAIESVLRQTYPHWELCVADDGSDQPHVRTVLEEYAAKDERIKFASGAGLNSGGQGSRRAAKTPGSSPSPAVTAYGISATTNAALELATGDYIALLDHDDELAEHALFRMANAIVADPAADMLYSDEDKLQPDGKRVRPFFKPDWSPEFFLGCMYTCHLGVYRTKLARELGGFRPEFDGAQDYDLVLRLIEQTERIVHVPDVLYHWRVLPESTAAGVGAKPHAHAAGLRALQDHLRRTARPGRTEVGPSAGLNWVRFEVVGAPTVSVIIPSMCQSGDAGPSMLERCIASINRTRKDRRIEIIVVDRNTMPPEMEHSLARVGVRRVTYDEPFNWSRVNNLAARHATGDHLLFLNDDTEAVEPGWLDAMLEYSQQPEIGVVGAKLVFPDGGLQHVGVTLPGGKPGHPFYGYPAKHTGYYCRNVLPHDCAAVTGASLMTRRDVFAEVGGFDESFPLNYNDIDYCMKVRRLDYRVVFTPHAKLVHHESVTKSGVFEEELDAFRARWGEVADPYYNPNLSAETFDYRVGE